ncbi:MAG TPA: SDR family NAD(P)-dependent oxidoreductase [Microbacterium sp.]|nr:SDR family NAD(P)-dependent oxidoreductase [Microbacterium sp.]
MPTVALVTGANRGLGFATAEALARTGATVIITGRDDASARTAAARLAEQGLAVEALAMDVTSPVDVKGAAEAVSERHGRLDILVNNAGILPEATSEGRHEFADVNAFASTFETNVLGVANVTEHFLPLLRSSSAGRIVNISSTMGSLSDQSDPSSPYYGSVLPAYQASKAAVNSITVGLSKHLAGTDIKVTAVCPGWVQTDLAPGNRDNAPTSAEEAAQIVVTAATLPADAPSGTFISAAGPVPW